MVQGLSANNHLDSISQFGGALNKEFMYSILVKKSLI